MHTAFRWPLALAALLMACAPLVPANTDADASDSESSTTFVSTTETSTTESKTTSPKDTSTSTSTSTSETEGGPGVIICDFPRPPDLPDIGLDLPLLPDLPWVEPPTCELFIEAVEVPAACSQAGDEALEFVLACRPRDPGQSCAAIGEQAVGLLVCGMSTPCNVYELGSVRCEVPGGPEECCHVHELGDDVGFCIGE